MPNPPQNHAQREAAALRLSAVASLALAVVGLVWGLAVASQVIVFDAVYSLIGFVLAWFGLRAAALVEQGPTPHYPFGREALAPLVVGVQALVLIATFGYAVIDAVAVILAGGSETELGAALVYALITTVVCVAVHRILVRQQDGSDLVAAEAMQWRAAVVLGVAMAIGFTVAVALGRSEWSELAPYADPVLVLLVAGLILPAPFRLLRAGVPRAAGGNTGRQHQRPHPRHGDQGPHGVRAPRANGQDRKAWPQDLRGAGLHGELRGRLDRR